MLVLLGAPLGNVGDASTRLREELARADVIAAEDTRRLHRLVHDLGVTVSGRIVSYFEGNEDRRTAELVQAARDGARVALVTDGGMPSVSDPGYRLVRAALDAGLPVTAAPGPSAVTTALALSGLPCDRFCFEGFLPRSRGERRARLAALATEERTLVLFEAPHRLAEMLVDAAAAFGLDRPAAVCREMTKTYEEVRRGALGELAAWAAASQRYGARSPWWSPEPSRRRSTCPMSTSRDWSRPPRPTACPARRPSPPLLRPTDGRAGRCTRRCSVTAASRS